MNKDTSPAKSLDTNRMREGMHNAYMEGYLLIKKGVSDYVSIVLNGVTEIKEAIYLCAVEEKLGLMTGEQKENYRLKTSKKAEEDYNFLNDEGLAKAVVQIMLEYANEIK